MNRRISALAGLNPITESPNPRRSSATASDRHPRLSPPQGDSKATTARTGLDGVVRRRVTVWLPEDLIEKARAAVVLDGALRGITGLSAWLEDVVGDEIRRLEQQRGEELMRLPARVLPKGHDARKGATR